MKVLLRTGCVLLLAGLSAYPSEGQTVLRSSAAGDSTQVNKRTPPNVVRKPAVKKIKPIRTELSFGARLNTDGWSIFADKGYVRSQETKYSDMFHDMVVFQAEFSEKKHPKETRTTATDLNGSGKSRTFIYGKINNFYNLKLGYGRRRMIAGKPEQGTVSIHWVYVGGLSVGLEKPYYIDAYVPQDNSGNLVLKSIKYEDSTKAAFLDENYIVGSAGFSKGLGELKVVPGLHLKTGLHFDFAARRTTKLAVEVGVSGELYTRKIQMMANQDAVPYFANIYASLQFGKRW